ncbi:hypothetical protein DMN91_011204 [Ooceraea biroi]|uniref:Uncharacterized protein n=1 Tax=Ooceraea biroi TaxID=2015173 RepID=A0A3L8D9E6_OOCBI|nr:hypothetical protein DMN91_011204 [Ooceraea biroi]
MDSFNNYGRSDLSEMYSSFINLPEEENTHLLLDMDTLVPKRSSFLASRGCEPAKKKCSLGNEGEEIDGTGWSDKPVKNWCQEETINWLMSAASYMGQPYSSIQHSLAVPGKEIVTFTRQDFINHDPIYGDQLYDLLHSQHGSNLLPSFDTIQPQSEDEYARISSNNISDAESDNSVEVTTKRLPGRPRVLKTKKNRKYYYKSKIFLPVLGRRLVYQFGPNAKGWQTDNPNFRH